VWVDRGFPSFNHGDHFSWRVGIGVVVISGGSLFAGRSLFGLFTGGLFGSGGIVLVVFVVGCGAGALRFGLGGGSGRGGSRGRFGASAGPGRRRRGAVSIRSFLSRRHWVLIKGRVEGKKERVLEV
jgi:hypothetical protein